MKLFGKQYYALAEKEIQAKVKQFIAKVDKDPLPGTHRPPWLLLLGEGGRFCCEFMRLA